jgi:N-acetylmuramoyl-L-alanine amidase
MLKKLCAALLALMAAATLSAPAAGAVAVKTTVAGTPVASLVIGNTTYVSLRDAATALADCEIGWKDGAATVSANGLTMTVRLFERYLTANGRCLYIPDGVRAKDGRLYVPVRVLAKCFGASVTWNGADGTVTVGRMASFLAAGSAYYDADDLYWLSHIISAESEAEPLKGKIAVGNVVLNRVASDEFPDTVYDVIFDRNYGVQFTPVANGTVYNEPDAESILAAKLVLDGAKVVPDNCLYFLEEAMATNLWTVRNRDYAATIGSHSFYL